MKSLQGLVRFAFTGMTAVIGFSIGCSSGPGGAPPYEIISPSTRNVVVPPGTPVRFEIRANGGRSVEYVIDDLRTEPGPSFVLQPSAQHHEVQALILPADVTSSPDVVLFTVEVEAAGNVAPQVTSFTVEPVTGEAEDTEFTAQVMATERLLAKNKERLEAQRVDLDSKIRASVKMGRDDIATAYIGQLQQVQIDLVKTGQQLEHAGNASKQALKARDNYVLQMQRRTAEAMQLINQEQLAQTMESFQLGDDASTFNEMRDKIDRRAAAAEAKMQLGSASVDTQMQEIEREALDMQLADKLLEYKRDMGLLGAGTNSPQALPAEGETTGGQNGSGR